MNAGERRETSATVQSVSTGGIHFACPYFPVIRFGSFGKINVLGHLFEDREARPGSRQRCFRKTELDLIVKDRSSALLRLERETGSDKSDVKGSATRQVCVDIKFICPIVHPREAGSAAEEPEVVEITGKMF